MMDHSRYRELMIEAASAYEEGRFYEAASEFEQAHHYAKYVNEDVATFDSGQWAAESWALSGNPHRAERLLESILSSVPKSTEPLTIWYARNRMFSLQLDWSPSLQKLREHLTALKALRDSHVDLPIADYHLNSAVLLAAQGKFSDALVAREEAWKWRSGGIGYEHHCIAFVAVYLGLILGNRTAAAKWLENLKQVSSSHSWARIEVEISETWISMFDGNASAAQRHIVDAADYPTDEGSKGHQNLLNELRVRTLLLDPELGDPTKPSHPARLALRPFNQSKRCIDQRFVRSLLVADYRLACVRHAIGMPPVQDLFCTGSTVCHSDQTTFDRPLVVARALHALRVYKQCRRHAQFLDECFDCMWRQAVVSERLKRLEAMCRSVGIRVT